MHTAISDANKKNTNGNLQLHIAILLDDAEKFKVLVKSGADTNVQNIHGDTPLHLASYLNKPRTVNLLLKRGGANPYTSNERMAMPCLVCKKGIIPCIFIYHEVVNFYNVVCSKNQYYSRNSIVYMINQLKKYADYVYGSYDQLSLQEQSELQSILQLPNQEYGSDCPLFDFIQLKMHEISSADQQVSLYLEEVIAPCEKDHELH